jgi:hypothetical protein
LLDSQGGEFPFNKNRRHLELGLIEALKVPMKQVLKITALHSVGVNQPPLGVKVVNLVLFREACFSL